MVPLVEGGVVTVWTDFVAGFGVLLGYFSVGASAALLLRRTVALPTEVFRKILHAILVGSIFPWVHVFDAWWMSVLAAIVFVAVVFPILWVAESWSGYSDLLAERGAGEIRLSLVVVFVMFSLVVALCWGWVGERYLVIAAVLAWGLGDAAAALVGGYLGRHPLEGRLIEGRKSVEGTVAMFAASFVAVLAVLLANRPETWSDYLTVAVLTAAVCALVELFTKGGLDTLTCPLAAAATMVPLTHGWA